MKILLKEPGEIKCPWKGDDCLKWGFGKHAVLKAMIDVDIDELAESWCKSRLMHGALPPGDSNKFSQYLKEKSGKEGK
uniref:Uncharacterized protein n=1 Tax=viral metagenome TaxID=1070528 RepID=A0A6M3J216_9ZZZZ